MPKSRGNGEGSFRIRCKSVEFRWAGHSLSEPLADRSPKLLRSRLYELVHGPEQYDPDILLKDWAEQWYTDQEKRVEAGELEESTYEGYKYTKELIKRAWPTETLIGITADDIERGLREIKKPVQAADKSITWAAYDFRNLQKMKAMLGQMFKYAIKKKKIDRLKNPMLDVDKLKNTERPKNRKGAYTNVEIAKLYRNLAQDRTGHLIRVCISCGFRGQEMLALGPEKIEPDGSIIEIDEAVKRGKKGRPYIGVTKSPKSDRQVHVPAIAQPSAKFLRDNAADGFILPNGEGSHIGWTCYRERYNKAIMEAGVIPITPHHMRNTYTTLERVRLHEADDLVMSNTGHSDLETTRGYTEVQAEEKQQAAERLDAYLREIIKTE